MNDNNIKKFKLPTRIPLLILTIVIWLFLFFWVWLIFQIDSIFFLVVGIFLLIHSLFAVVLMIARVIYEFGTTFVINEDSIKELRFHKTAKEILKEDIYATIFYRAKHYKGYPSATLYILPKEESGKDDQLYNYNFEKLSINSSFFKVAKKDKRVIKISNPSKEIYDFITKTFAPAYKCYDNDTWLENIAP